MNPSQERAPDEEAAEWDEDETRPPPGRLAGLFPAQAPPLSGRLRALADRVADGPLQGGAGGWARGAGLRSG